MLVTAAVGSDRLHGDVRRRRDPFRHSHDFESKAWVACISMKRSDDRYDSRFQIFTAAAWALPCR
jgi:hypothetical protein